MKNIYKLLTLVGIFAVAFAYIESSVVVYLRAVYGIEDLLKDTPLITDQFTFIEIGREAATLIIMIMIGWISGKKLQDKIGYGIFAFGIWDIFYYVWLYIFIGWPTSLLDWDILFLIPLPWWGPVITPVLISILMIISGIFAVLKSEQNHIIKLGVGDFILGAIGILLILFSFMYDAIIVLPQGMEAVAAVKPCEFNWLIYFAGFAGLTIPMVRITYKSVEN